MATNPYESPETISHPAPPQKSNLPGLLFRLFAGVAILALLVALLLPATRTGGRESVRRIQCSNHLKQIGLALQNYHDDFGSFPPAYISDSTGKPIHSWRVLILPYMEHKTLYDKYSFDEPWDGPNNSKLHLEKVATFCCPSYSQQMLKPETGYVVVIGAQTAWTGDKATALNDITDRTSDALLVVEMANSGIHWMEPRDLDMAKIPMTVNPKGSPGISGDHPNVAMALFADGHTAALTNGTPSEIIRRLLTIADGEPVGEY